MEVLVFGGTAEGRELVAWLDARGTCDVVACTATEYGASLVEGGAHVQVVRGPLSPEDKRVLMAEHDFACVVDATHPYATHISQSVAELARQHDVDLLRVVRESAAPGAWTSVASMEEAAAHVAARDGNVLLTTGSKDLGAFVGGFGGDVERLYVRVLPVEASLRRVAGLGIPVSHTIAMQGPFSARLNEALMREFHIRNVVTKQSGAAGGFCQKAEAARACGAELVVVERPQAEEGPSLEETKRRLEVAYGL